MGVINMVKQEECKYCNGTGKQTCYSCSGAGSKIEVNLVYIPIFGYALPETKICYSCNGTGRTYCPYCHGTGKS